jgi:hypothetical protein
MKWSDLLSFGVFEKQQIPRTTNTRGMAVFTGCGLPLQKAAQKRELIPAVFGAQVL